jgi:hypothetical protein
VERALENMRTHMMNNGLTSVTSPKLACGIDQLSWPIIEDTIKRVFHQTDIEVTICQIPAPGDKKVPTKLEMTEFRKHIDEIGQETYDPVPLPNLEEPERQMLKLSSDEAIHLIEFPNTILEELPPDLRTPMKICVVKLKKLNHEEDKVLQSYMQVMKEICHTDYSLNDLRRAQRTDLITKALRDCMEDGELKDKNYDAETKKLVVTFF